MRTTAMGAGLVAALCAACSSGDDGTTSASDGGEVTWQGTGGMVGTAPSAQAAFYIEVGGPSCSTNPPPFSLPAGTDAAVAIRTNGGEGSDGEIYRVVDGEDDVTVSCTVQVDGDQATISGQIQSPRVVSVEASGELGLSNGTLSLREFDNTRVSTLSGDCEVQIHYVNPGAFWGSFSCPTFSGGTEQCEAAGSIVLENCQQ